MLDKAKQYLCENLNKKCTYLLGLSGGSDSLALFYLLVDEGWNFHACYVNHGLREESHNEGDELANICQNSGVPFHLVVLEDIDYKAGNLEGRFRELRYLHLRNIYENTKCNALLLGHHRDDQVETILKRVLEGSSLINLSGMQLCMEKNGMKIVRPLLFHKKSEMIDFLLVKDKKFFSDYTNYDCKYLRARMREEIIPWLEKSFNKNIRDNLVIFGSRMDEIYKYLHFRISHYLEKLKFNEFGAHIEVPKDLHDLEIEYFLRFILKNLDISLSRKEIEKIHSIIKLRKNGKRHINGFFEIIFLKDTLFFFDIEKCANNENKKRNIYQLCN